MTLTPAKKGSTLGKTSTKKKPSKDALLTLVQSSLEDNKAENLTVIDLAGKTSMADHMIVASGTSQRHVGSMADHLSRQLRESGFGRPKVEGLPQADWVLVDAGDIIIHLFRPEVREFYNLEKMWTVDFNSQAV